jgi:hypothetical protein
LLPTVQAFQSAMHTSQGRPVTGSGGIIMKLQALSLAIAFTGIAGVAAAADNTREALPPVVVSGEVAACRPPSAAPACGNFHRFIRANFSSREISMLFGNRTSYPEYLTGGIDRVQRRYQLLTQEYVATQTPAAWQIAAK